MSSTIKVGDWICVGESRIHARVFRIISDTEVYAGYLQSGSKAIGENFIWDGHIWRFKDDGPNGAYLTDSDARIVKRGPLVSMNNRYFIK
ncbi:TPA: hypothetical protein ACX6SF_002439 [Photobacterium damselae]